MLVPIITLLVGFAYLIFSRRLLHIQGLEALPRHPEAIGEGRSSYAGILLALSLGCLLLQEPMALQPGLNLMLALAWLLAGAGWLLQMVIERARGVQQIAKVMAALALGMLALWTAEPAEPGFRHPNGYAEWIFLGVAVLTGVLGLISLVLPRLALKILRLQNRVEVAHAVGEPRGILAGFNLSLGATYIFVPQAQLFVGLVLGAAWILTGAGRVLSVVVDRGASVYNFLAILFEIGLGAVLLALIFGLI